MLPFLPLGVIVMQMVMLSVHREPLVGFRFIDRHALAAQVHQAQVVARFMVALIGCLAEPLHGFERVLRCAVAILQHAGYVVLGVHLAFFGQRQPDSECGFIILLPMRHCTPVKIFFGAGMGSACAQGEQKGEQKGNAGEMPQFTSPRLRLQFNRF